MAGDEIRIHFAVGQCLGKAVASIEYFEWERLVRSDGQLTLLTGLPSSFEAMNTLPVTAVASGTIGATGGMDIVRLDPKDTPFIYNLDNYTVIERLPDLEEFADILRMARVEDSHELRTALRQHVYFLKSAPTSAHWLSDIPEYIRAAKKKQ